MSKEKQKRQYRLRQTVTLFSYLLPAFVPTGFDLEAPLSLETVCERLKKIERVRESKNVSSAILLMNVMFSEANDYMPTAVTAAPFEVTFHQVDDDTYQYQIDASEDRFHLTVRGYLKRWEQDSTLVTGKVQFDLHYLGILVKSLAYMAILVASVVVGGAFLTLFRVMPFDSLATIANTPPVVLLPAWVILLIVLWLNDVAAPAHVRRARLLTRIEDMVLFPNMAGGGS